MAVFYGEMLRIITHSKILVLYKSTNILSVKIFKLQVSKFIYHVTHNLVHHFMKLMFDGNDAVHEHETWHKGYYHVQVVTMDTACQTIIYRGLKYGILIQTISKNLYL